MSVALLSRLKQVEICDELESFFYVILYYAVRYLHSNIKGDVGNWIHDFFDTYGVNDDTYVCGQVKLNAIENGKLLVSAGKTLKFNSPMDGVIADLLARFKAHHAVTMYALNKDKQQASPEVGPEMRPRSLLGALLLPSDFRGPGFDESDFDEADEGVVDEETQEPSEKEKELSESVCTHKAMLNRLHRAIQPDQPWMSDKAGDRVPKDFRPPEQVLGPNEPVSVGLAKRARLDMQTVAMPFSLPDFPPPRPPKTPDGKPRCPDIAGLAKRRRY